MFSTSVSEQMQSTGLPTARNEPVPPPAFHVMLKPRGAICNLDCRYCYYLSKERLYAGSRFRMTDKLLQTYTRQYIEAQGVPEVTFAWQGGEPTLMGLEFFKRAVELQREFNKPGIKIYNAIQTNGVLLDDNWCEFFRENEFLVGISIDGPEELHDYYRVDKGGNPTFQQVMKGHSFLEKHEVEFNVLTALHAANVTRPLEVYRFLRDEVGARFIQFIPIVERENGTGFQEDATITDQSLTGNQYGRFLTEVFDEWVRRDVGKVFVQIFDVALAAWAGQVPGLCVFNKTCGRGLALEHNGDLYSCDHFVEPKHKLGNIMEIPLVDMVNSEKQRDFGRAKLTTLPRYCKECEIRYVCNGGCPKNRFTSTPHGEYGLNYLCSGYKRFFKHIDAPMRFMAAQLRARRPPSDIMYHLAREERAFQKRLAKARRNEPCPCGSGKKYKWCHGRTDKP